MLGRFDRWPPEVGPTGARVVESEVSVETENQFHQLGAPSKPTRLVDVYVDWSDEPITHERTDEELAAATVEYEAALTEWKLNDGIYVERGPTRHTARVRCADGSTGEAISGDGKSGVWIKFEPHGGAQDAKKAHAPG